MKRLAALTLALALLPAVSAQGKLDFRIVIPSVLRQLENSVAGTQQRLVVETNVRRGFCAHLSAPAEFRAGWRTEIISAPLQSTLSPQDSGYVVCVPRAGTHTVVLNHTFSPTPSIWPVQTILIVN